MNKMTVSKEIVPESFFKPSELLNIFKNFLSNKEINATVLCLHGIYWKSDKTYGNVAYDRLKDENSADEITIVIPLSLREDLKNGNLVSIYGTMDRRLNQSGCIQILLNVTRVEKVKELAISEDEVKRAEFRRIKGEHGYKNVDGLLENKLFAGVRPKVALIYAGTSITDADFEKGLAAAKSHIDFVEYRVNFANPTALCSTLIKLDIDDTDIIAIVRGGGSGIEKLDDLNIVEALTNLSTAWIYGVGHEKENLFIRNIADKVIPIPFALGTYFRDTVETVMQKRNNSRAVLIQEVKKQYEKQIEDSNKKNQELAKQMEALQKQNKEQTEASNKQIEALAKAQKDSQVQIKEQTNALNKTNEEAQKLVKDQTESLRKANEEAQKQANAQIDSAAKINKELQEQLSKQGKTLEEFHTQQKKQQEDFGNSLSQMQITNNRLQESLNRLTTQSTQAAKDLQDAKDRARELEHQLQESKKGCAMPGCLSVFAIILLLLGSCCFL